jgi:hypothetical protein
MTAGTSRSYMTNRMNPPTRTHAAISSLEGRGRGRPPADDRLGRRERHERVARHEFIVSRKRKS